MDSFVLYLDMTEVMEKHKDLTETIQKRLATVAQQLTVQAHSHILEEAAKKLHSRHDMFREHLRWEQIDTGTYAVVIPQEIMWIEEGMEPHSMLDDLLKSPKAKTVKKGPNKGGKYIIVPFKHTKAPTRSTPHQTAIRDTLKKELKALNIPFKQIEREPSGAPKMGLIHKLDLNTPSKRLKQGHQGPAGFPMATHNLQTGAHGPEGRPFLMGARIYQKPKRDADGNVRKDKKGHSMVSREIFTFRVASSRHAGSGKWFHPGLPPMNFIEDAYRYVKDLWDTQVAPEILKDLT